MSEVIISCPNCEWLPQNNPDWNCLQCGMDIDLFENLGRCSHCGYNHEKVYCLEEYGGCGKSSPLIDWYGDLDAGLEKLDIHKL